MRCTIPSKGGQARELYNARYWQNKMPEEQSLDNNLQPPQEPVQPEVTPAAPPEVPTETVPSEQKVEVPPEQVVEAQPVLEPVQPTESVTDETQSTGEGSPLPSSLPSRLPAPRGAASGGQAGGEGSIVRQLLLKAREAIQSRKRKKLEKILQLVQQKGSIRNDEVEKALRMSDSTATRYLNQLIREGKIKRVGAAEHARYEPA